MVGYYENRLNFAIQNGFADNIVKLPLVKPASQSDSLDIAKKNSFDIVQNTDGYDVVFECTGVESCMQTAIQVRIYFKEH